MICSLHHSHPCHCYHRCKGFDFFHMHHHLLPSHVSSSSEELYKICLISSLFVFSSFRLYIFQFFHVFYFHVLLKDFIGVTVNMIGYCFLCLWHVFKYCAIFYVTAIRKEGTSPYLFVQSFWLDGPGIGRSWTRFRECIFRMTQDCAGPSLLSFWSSFWISHYQCRQTILLGEQE